MPPSSLIVLLSARAGVEGFALGVGAWLGLAALGGAPPLLRLWLMTAGAALVIAAAGRATRDSRRRVLLAAVAVAAAAAAGSLMGGDDAGGTMMSLARGTFGAFYGALVCWRGLTIAEAPHRWREMALATLASLVATAVATLASGAVPGGDAVTAVIALGPLCAIGLSTARGAEELLFAEHRGPVRTGLALRSAAAVGAGAVTVAAAFPNVGLWLSIIAAAIQPFVTAGLILLVTPFVYVAEWLVRALLPLLRAIPVLRIPLLTVVERSPAEDAEYARQLALQAEVFLKGFVVVVAVAIVSLLVMHAVAARRVNLPAGAALEREPIPGGTFGELWRRFVGRPRRPARPGGHDPAARVRRAYWDMLDLAERVGSRWREPAETPREHLAELGDGWEEAEPIVAAFEIARYADRATDREASAAEQALRHVTVALSRRA